MNDKMIQSSQIKTRCLLVGRYILFFTLLISSLIAINIQVTAVDILSLSATKNGYPKLVRLLAAFKSALGTVQPVHAIAVIAFAWLYYRNILKKNSKFYLTAFITGGIFSLCLIIGMSFAKYEDFSFINNSKYQIIIAMTVFCGYWGFLYSAVCEIIKKLDVIKLPEESLGKVAKWIDQHLFVAVLAFILLCWLPFCVVYFPGSMIYDAQNQLNQFYGISTLTNHHPVFSTLIMGAIVKFGDIIYSKSFGVGLYMVFQTIVCALVYTSICVYLRKKKLPFAVVLGAILFYAIIPTFGAYAQAVLKDSLFCGIFAWFALEYIKCFFGDDGKYGYLRLAIAASLVCLLRNEGVYIVLLTLFILLVIKKGNKKHICVVLIAAFIAGIGINHMVVDALGIRDTSNSTRESMSIPFMQIARYVRDCGDNLTDEEVKVIDSILVYDKLAENYNPELSDDVKKLYRSNATKEDWNEFWKLWVHKLIERPDVFLEATICQCYGYFHPFYFYRGTLGYYLTIRGPITDKQEEPVYDTYVFSDGTRQILTQYTGLWQKTPVLSFLVNCGAYTWAGILLFALLIRKKDWRDAIIFLIPILNITICCLSPINGSLRYYIPIMASMPLYVFLGLKPYLFPETGNREGNQS